MARATSDSDNIHGTGDLNSPSFLALLFTQWLTAINDNAFRWLVIGIGKDYVSPANISSVLMAGTACFVLPYLILASPAGFLADRFSKRNVIVACKIAEIVVMILGVIVIWIGSFYLLLIVVALMGAQSALFSPAKMGTIPELVATKKISAANGWFGLSTVTATLIGMAIGNALADYTAPRGLSNLWVSAAVLIGIATVGTIISLVIQRVPAADRARKFPWLAPIETIRDLGTLFSHRKLFAVSLGKVFFWSVAVMAQLNIDQFSSESGGLLEFDKIPFLVSLVFGVGLGSVMAGFLSAGKIELGMLWLGALGISLFAQAMFFAPPGFMENGFEFNHGFVISCFFLLLLGASAGLFDVPLSSYLQEKSPRIQRGAILSANNFMLFSGMLVASLLFGALRTPAKDGSEQFITQKYFHDVSSEQKAELAPISSRFTSEWENYRPPPPKLSSISKTIERGDEPKLESCLEQGPEELQQVLFADLLWQEMRIRRAKELPVIREEYYQRFAPAIESEKLSKTERALANHQRRKQLNLIKDIYEQTSKLPLLSSRQIFLLIGCIGLPVLAFVLYQLPLASFRFVAWRIAKLFYSVRIRNADVIPENGAVLVSNRCSKIDHLLLSLSMQRKVRRVTNEETESNSLWRTLFGEIELKGGAKKRQDAMVEARKALGRSELLLICPETELSTTGQVRSYDDVYMKLISVSPVPVVPVYFDGLRGSRVSHGRRGGFWNLTLGRRQKLTVTYGKPVKNDQSKFQLRQAVLATGDPPVTEANSFIAPPKSFIRRCKQRMFTRKVGDLTGAENSGGSLLMRTLILRRLLNRHVLEPQDQTVGVLIPPSVGGVVVNVALAIDKRVTVNLNYTASAEVLNACIKVAGVRKILTTRKVYEKLKLKLDGEIVMLDDLKDKVTTGDKFHGIAGAYLKPASMLEKSLGLCDIQPDDVLTVIFTSGSTGVPKGVQLTHQNIATQIESIQNVIHLTREDSIVGILPFFHSFGYTVALWGVMGLDIAAAYHFTPLDGRQVGKLVRTFKGTCLLATPTFLRTYLRRTSVEDFATLTIVVVGAEKLSTQLSDAFEEKFGVRPVEGYGATELSPLVSVNVPPGRSSGSSGIDAKEGSVGRPIPNVEAKIVDDDTDAVLGVDQPGMLWITGPNVMKGYLGRDDLTADVIKDGWYKTGDLAMIDEDGFIIITGRQSRFSKIAGEMVPHISIEEKLNELIGADEEEGMKAVVTAVPDEKKGERLIVLHSGIDKSTDELMSGLKEAGFPNLYIPSQDSFFEIDEIPVLGTGKLDLHGIKKRAMDVVGM